jgi:hypothetical protein
MSGSSLASMEQDGSRLRVRWYPQVTALLLIAVELCWLVPWYRTVLQVSYVPPALFTTLVLGAVMLAAYLTTYALESLRLIRGFQVGILVVVFVVSLLAASRLLLGAHLFKAVSGLAGIDPGEVLVVLFVLWLWWRGIGLGREPIRPATAYRRFEIGLLLYLAHVFIMVRMRGQTPGLGLFVLFLFLGLLSVIFARVSFVGLSQGVRKNPFDRRWFFSTAGILVLTVGVAAILGSVMTGQYALLLEMLASGVKYTAVVLIFILSLPGLLLSYLFAPLAPLLRRGLESQAQTPDPYALYPGALPNVPRPEPRPIPEIFASIFFWGLVILLLVLVIQRARKAAGTPRPWRLDESESLLKEGQARHLLRNALQDMVDGVASRLRLRQRHAVAARIRRIYILLMDLCEELGIPRPASKTPLEFLPEIGELFPAYISDLDLLTQAYVKIRYGELPETQKEVAAIETAWERIKEEGERLKRSGVGALKTAELKDWQKTGV